MRSYHIWTIGCQMNVSDSHRLAQSLEELGYRRSSRLEEADIMVLNTCVVRQSAEDKVIGRLSSLKHIKKRRPEALLAVMGCFVGQDTGQAELLESFPFIDLLLPPSDPSSLLDVLKQRDGRKQRQTDRSRQQPSPVCAYSTIIRGCNNFCSYCIVPYRRGPEASKPVDEVVREVSQLAEAGAREVTLLGQNVDSYGRDLPGQPTLADLLLAVHEIEGLRRIRFLTSHPKDMSTRLIETIASLPKVCEHIELPVQAGSDAVLQRMNRNYTVARYRELIHQIRAHLPGVGLSTDVVVGFPGETGEEFEQTYSLLQEVRFDTVHVASYSPRPGTAAARLADDVPTGEKERRRRAVEELQERIAREINARLLGHTTEILVEGRHKGKWRGRTRTNKLVFFEDTVHNWQGELVHVRITWTGPWSMQGEVDDRNQPLSETPHVKNIGRP